MIGLVDYGMGNRRSVEKALEHVGASVLVSSDPLALAEADALVVPGVGAFPRAMERLRALGLDGFLTERAGAGVPLLGICLGMHLFFERSSELGGSDGLGIVSGEVRALEVGELKTPQIGWNEVRWERSARVLEGLGEAGVFYHVHSFVAVPEDPADVLGTAEYGERFASVVAHGSFVGVQFHPEKSSHDGLRLLANWVARCGQRWRVILDPAIDILGGRAVRLVQGDFDQATEYADDPLDAARAWAADGAARLHVVDLDGARGGAPVNLAAVTRIVAETGLPVQLGGGLRSAAAIAAAFAAGVQRVVLGTAAFADAALLDAALAAHGDRVVVSVDVRGGMVSTAGWTKTGSLAAVAAVAARVGRGVRRFVYTDVDRDGMLGGLDLDALGRVGDAVEGELLYSGGVGSLADLQALVALRHPRIAGAIVGKALYERRFTIAEAEAVLCS